MREVKEGFEEEFESLMAKKEALERDKALAINEAIAEVEAKFADREKTIQSLLMMISVEVEDDTAEGDFEEAHSDRDPDEEELDEADEEELEDFLEDEAEAETDELTEDLKDLI